MTNRCIKVSITTPGPGLLHRFTGHSAPLLATYRQHLLARGWDLGLLGHWGGCGEEGLAGPLTTAGDCACVLPPQVTMWQGCWL